MSRKTNKIDHKNIEKKWKKRWAETKLYQPNLKTSKKPFYNLMMYPYPSAEGLHVGNMYAFTGADVYGRFQRMNGSDVFEPIGLDGFGIHSENYAISVGRHPKKHAEISEKNFYRQLSIIGNGFAWDNRLETYDPDYYKWTQWIFIQMFKNGLAYKGEATVNWCPSCKTVLADEQVINGHCERCKHEVERRKMSSWYFRITKYADRLLDNIDGTKNKGKKGFEVGFGPADKNYDVKRDGLRWPEKIKVAQRNWIGRKEGINITYPIKGSKKTITCFTTRPDTNFGATFIVVAPEYAKKYLMAVIPQKHKKEVSKYVEMSLNKTEQQRQEEGREKTGEFLGLYAVNQLNGYEMPIWVSDFVLMDFGTGAVVGVPGHDKRDFEFAKKYDTPIIRVVVGEDKDKSKITKIEQVQEDEGTMINSEFLNGLDIHKATQKMMDYIEDKGWGKRELSYHLRDWLISRQRYWGAPIPMVFCKACKKKGKGEVKSMPGWYSVPEKDLPVKLPDVKDFKPKGDGTSPLSNAPSAWKYTKCPGCGTKAERELDVSDTFLDSSWYFLAYPNLKTKDWSGTKLPFNKEITKKWLPVDAYIGGAEHAVLHLLYSRFVTMALKDWDYLPFEEPFPFLFGHGLLIKDGAKMSKSRGNIVVPDDYIEKFGADALRTYLMFLGPFDQGGDFRDTGMEGMQKFMMRVWELYMKYKDTVLIEGKSANEILVKMHQTIKKVTEDIQEFKYNTAIAAIMEFVNLLRELAQAEGVDRIGRRKVRCAEWDQALETLALILAPFAPYMTEEIWVEKLGRKFSVHTSPWPTYVEKLVQETQVTVAVQVDGKLRGTLSLDREVALDKDKVVSKAKKDKKVAKWLKGKSVKNTIFVGGKLVNFVTK
jgi:leucyl-tRNA synthetase